MLTDRNLLLATEALRKQLIDAAQLADACLIWQQRRDVSLGELLVELGWIKPDDKIWLESLIDAQRAAQNAATQMFIDEAQPDTTPTLDQNAGSTILTWNAPILADPSNSPPPVGSDRYDIGQLHAEGGIGRIWLAYDSQLNRNVAIKTLRPEFLEQARVRNRFLQEAQITGQLEHPGIVPVYELGAQPESHQIFYAMRFVRGRTLVQAARDFHQRRRAGESDGLELVALLSAFVTVCNTVAYAHSRGVIHRDLKGENVLLGDFGEVLLLDWGVAKIVERSETETAPETESPSHDGPVDQTLHGDVIGTPAYMAPEQAEGRLDEINQRTDLYGLGAILYEILTGQPPFTGSNTIELLQKVLRDEPIAPRLIWPEVPAGLEAICLQALAKNPQARHASASVLAQQVQAWQETQRRQAEEALRRQGEILQSILDNMGEGLLVTDEQGRLMLMNPAAERLLGAADPGTSHEEMFARFEIFLADGVTRCLERDLPSARAIRGEVVDDAELLIVAHGATEGRWMSANARALKNRDCSAQGAVVVLRDITERRRAAEELRRSRERFELAVQGSQDGLWDWDLQTNEVYYSPRWKSILGYEDHEIAHRLDEWEARLHPDEREQVLAANYAHINGTTSHYEYEYRLRHKNGSFRWILARGVALRDAQGKAYRMAGSHVDITGWKELERQLQESQERYRTLLEATPYGLLMAGPDGRIAQANAEAARLLGVSLDEIMRSTLDELWARAARPGKLPAAPHAAAWPDSVTILGFRQPDGTVNWLSAASHPIGPDDAPDRFGQAIVLRVLPPEQIAG